LSEHVSIVSFLPCILNIKLIEVLKYVGHICKFNNPTIIFKVFVEMMVVAT